MAGMLVQGTVEAFSPTVTRSGKADLRRRIAWIGDERNRSAGPRKRIGCEVPRREPIGPAIGEPVARHEDIQIFDVERAATAQPTFDRVVGPLPRVLEVVDVVAEARQAHDVLQVVPGHAAQRILRYEPADDDPKPGAHRAWIVCRTMRAAPRLARRPARCPSAVLTAPAPPASGREPFARPDIPEPPRAPSARAAPSRRRSRRSPRRLPPPSGRRRALVRTAGGG